MPISVSLRAALRSQNMADSLLSLVDVSHPDIDENIDGNGWGHLYATSDTVLTTSQGITYVPFWFDLQLAIDDPQQAPRAQLVISAVDGRVPAAIMEMGIVRPKVTMIVVRGSDPDYHEMVAPDFFLTQAQGDLMQITADLSMENLLQTQYPNMIVDTEGFPGAFA